MHTHAWSWCQNPSLQYLATVAPKVAQDGIVRTIEDNFNGSYTPRSVGVYQDMNQFSMGLPVLNSCVKDGTKLATWHEHRPTSFQYTIYLFPPLELFQKHQLTRFLKDSSRLTRDFLSKSRNPHVPFCSWISTSAPLPSHNAGISI